MTNKQISQKLFIELKKLERQLQEERRRNSHLRELLVQTNKQLLKMMSRVTNKDSIEK